MTTKAKPTPKTVSDLTLAELLALLRETVTESLAEIVGYPDEPSEPGSGADTESSEPARPRAVLRVQIVTDEAARAAKLARKVGGMTEGDLRFWVHQIVGEVGEDLIGDPDEGLELSDWAQEQLDRADAERAAGTLKTIPAAQVAKELGLDWPDDV